MLANANSQSCETFVLALFSLHQLTVSLASHAHASLSQSPRDRQTDGQTDGRTDKQKPDRCFALSVADAAKGRYDTRRYFNVRSKADIRQLNLPHGTKLTSGKRDKLKSKNGQQCLYTDSAYFPAQYSFSSSGLTLRILRTVYRY